jgi:hypothetical protein
MISKSAITASVGFVLFLGVFVPASSQMGFGDRWGFQPKLDIVSRFDTDADGKLNDTERQAAREYVRETRADQYLSTRTSLFMPAKTDLLHDLQESAASAPRGKVGLYDTVGLYDEVGLCDTVGLYDEKIVRTLYLRFSSLDWFGELSDFYNTDVEVTADLIVDGKVYPKVGVRFRGGSSYFTIGHSLKKSFNISIDYEDRTQRLYGYRTLNLLNSHADPSFVREVLFSRISRQYIPAPKANFVKLVINGENWGVYVNVQQFNNDFLQDWFGTTKGVRWKVPASRNSAGGLVYNGPDPAAYKRSFELYTEDTREAWLDLIELCGILTNTPDDQLEAKLNPVFDIDGALWCLALENVFIDSDGYISRGSDYSLYQDPQGRFYMITRDNNETFRYAGGGGPNRWPSSDPMLTPLAHEDNPRLPVISRLLAIPHIRARYLAHMKTIVREWLDWNVLGPIIAEYQSLIADEVKADGKKLYSYDSFAYSLSQDSGSPGGGSGRFDRFVAPSFKSFVTERREFLLSHPEINKSSPTVTWVKHQLNPRAAETVRVTAEIGSGTKVDTVLLYYAGGNDRKYNSVDMFDDGVHHDGKAGDGVYAGEIPVFPAGAKVRYYVEARAVESLGTTAFEPERAEWGARSYRIGSLNAENSPVVINELMAVNTRSIRDPQGEYDDWIELHNTADTEMDISGMYLSDREDYPRKWVFPLGTTIPPRGYLIVWADEDDRDEPGLHVNFRLSGRGERVILVDTDERGNQVLDSIEFGQQIQDISLGRYPDGAGGFRSLPMTPGKRNEL